MLFLSSTDEDQGLDGKATNLTLILFIKFLFLFFFLKQKSIITWCFQYCFHHNAQQISKKPLGVQLKDY